MLNDELLSVWLQLTNVIDNERLVEGMPFNEALVCGLLSAILRSLERKGVIARERSQTDRRCIELRLLPEGCSRYADGHRRALELVDRLIGAMGEEKVRTLIPLLHQVVDAFDLIQQEV